MQVRFCRNTGPTELAPQVLAALSRQVISHRSKEFAQLLLGVQAKLARVVDGAAATVVLTASGTGAMEAACAGLLSREDRVLLLSAGYYGELFGKIARYSSDTVDVLRFAPGHCVDIDTLRQALQRTNYAAVVATHSDSSTGVLHPLRQIAECVHAHSRALLLVDGVSSVGTAEVAHAAWGIDALVTGTQKGLMAPPGLSVVYLSDAGVAKLGAQRSCSHYLDLAAALENGRRGATPFTPAVNLVYALDTALDMLLAEGVPAVLERHRLAAEACRRILQDAGLRMFAQPGCASPGITSVRMPEGVAAEDVQAALLEQHGMTVSVGLSDWKSNVLRVGHMGWFAVDGVADAARRIAALDWERLGARAGSFA
ncbi:alanine--glyoxylate aminotransferase family protein [Ramlibacter sp.]|uniref:pyridoxal-phosphate-dependent aminotransferase family protein n=1 Tax=Ramlibacter sp. TaxID=1917967 RepID=UPI00179277E3|nr:alanine--glyoxylate aminotransferase family protein [Ramlibacter sp.]MBA2672838.1 alanine--glyoxylate aminotransferase family protein [Ramlibacter sp.]